MEKAAKHKGALYSYGHRLGAGILSFSPIEIGHLIIGIFIVLGVGLSIALQIDFISERKVDIWFIFALTLTSIFILHELAHKIVAQKYGLWAEFRLSLIGSLITLLSILSPIKFIAPGIVMIEGEMDREKIGKTALAGPVTNIAISASFLALAKHIANPFLFITLIIVGISSSWIALLNLIPFNILDGAKIFWWNKKIWAVSFLTSALLTLYALTSFFF